MNRFSFTLCILLLLLADRYRLAAQNHPSYEGTIIHMHSAHTSFPDTARLKGHVYDSVLYDAAGHYSDSSVLILWPSLLKKPGTLNIVFWFHGWRNNIDTALSYYRLKEQFLAANRNAILVLAETTKNAPDSYGGKLEQPGVFASLVDDVLGELKKNKLIGKNCKTGNIVLAGHSGAFRVIARILQNGGMKVQEVELFDALYGETNLYDNWIRSDSSHRFIHWYTNQGGGTDEVSIAFMNQLKQEGYAFLSTEEAGITSAVLQSSSILFVHSTRAHNDIIFNPDNFRLLLETSPYLVPFHER